MNRRVVFSTLILSLVVGWSWSAILVAHQDPCHRLHACPSDHQTYICGNRGRCDQCPDNQYCLAGKPRVASSPTPAPAPLPPLPSTTTTPSAVTVCFTPGDNCTNPIVKALGDAKRSLLVQAYSFTSAPIAGALLDAHKRGVQVQVILDKSQRTEQYSSADFLANQGVPTTIDAAHAISHHKVIIIDGETVITGSFNFTKAAQEKNAENVLIIRDHALAAQYTQNWRRTRSIASPMWGEGWRADAGDIMLRVLGWMLVGLLVGALATAVLPYRDGRDRVATLLFGVAGALLGEHVGRWLGVHEVGGTAGVLMRLLGALVLVMPYRLMASRQPSACPRRIPP